MADFRYLSTFCTPDIELEDDLLFDLDAVQALREYDDAVVIYFEGGGAITVHFEDDGKQA